MFFTLIQIGVIFLMIYLLAHEFKESWAIHKEIRKSEKKWDEWERIPGYWDVYTAERGGAICKLNSVAVKTSMSSETEKVEITPTVTKNNPTHSLVPAH